MWTEAVVLLLGPLRDSGAGRGQPLPVPCLGPLSMRYKVICMWMPLVLGLEVPGKG